MAWRWPSRPSRKSQRPRSKRRARGKANEGKGVTIYVDALKACADMKAVVESYMRGEFWVLVMKSETEGTVEKRSLNEMPSTKDADWSDWAKLGFEVLPLWGVTNEEVVESKKQA